MDQQPFGGIETFFARREWTADGQRILGAEIRLPRPADRSSRAARRIDRFYQLQCRAYLRYCERWLLPLAAEEARRALACGAPPPEAEAALTFCSAYAADGLWSLWTESRERVGGRTERQRRGDTWDTRTGYPLPLSAFFPPAAERPSCSGGRRRRSGGRRTAPAPASGRTGGGSCAAASAGKIST
jgi:hypothetical protein